MNKELATRLLAERGVGIFSKQCEEPIPPTCIGVVALFDIKIKPRSAVRCLGLHKDWVPEYADDGRTAVVWVGDTGIPDLSPWSSVVEDQWIGPPIIAICIAFGTDISPQQLKDKMILAESTVLNVLYSAARVKHRGPWALTEKEDGTFVARLDVAGIRESIPKELA